MYAQAWIAPEKSIPAWGAIRAFTFLFPPDLVDPLTRFDLTASVKSFCNFWRSSAGSDGYQSPEYDAILTYG